MNTLGPQDTQSTSLFQNTLSSKQGTNHMFNQETTQTTQFSRQEYNRLYYQTNKKRIHQKKKSRSRTNVLQLFAKGEARHPSEANLLKKIFCWAELIALAGLSIIMTLYLVREAAGFYLEGHDSPCLSYLKAGLVEGIAILFSFSRGKSVILKWSQKLVVVLLCSLTLWTMSGKLVRSAVHDSTQTRTLMKVVADLEGEEAQKERLHEVMIKREWVGSARRHEKELDLIREKLVAARQQLASLQSPDIIMNGLGILIAFRLLLVIANLVSIHRVVEYFSSDTVQQ